MVVGPPDTPSIPIPKNPKKLTPKKIPYISGNGAF